MHEKEIEAMARATCCPDGCDVIGCRGRLYAREATAALTALCTARPDVAAVLRGEAVVVPREATPEMLRVADNAMPPAYEDDPDDDRFVLYATWRAQWNAMLAASPYAKEPANVG